MYRRRFAMAALAGLLLGAPPACLAQFATEPFVPVVPLFASQDASPGQAAPPSPSPPAAPQAAGPLQKAVDGTGEGGQTVPFPPAAPPSPAPSLEPAPTDANRTQWGGVLRDSLVMLTIQHAYRVGWEARTREALKGPFFEDYVEALGIWRGWDDGDLFRNNWIGHPAMGSAAAFIYASNDPRTRRAEFWSRDYAKAKWRQFLWSNVYSLQFELGIASEASIGNVDQAIQDHVITPTLGVAWSVVEDWMYVKWLSGLTARKPALGNTLTSFLNPTRSMANICAFRYPWAPRSVPRH